MDVAFVWKQCSIFTLMWIAYASCFLLRRPIGLIKDELQESMTLSDDMLGYLDLAYALPYSLCSVTLNFLGDIIGAKKALGLGMIGSAVASSVMGKVRNYTELCLLYVLSGTFQSLCWPSSCSIVSSWFSNKNVTTMMALFGTCMLAGSITGSVIVVELKVRYGWRSVFLIPAAVVGFIGLLVLLFGISNTQVPNNETPKEIQETNSQPEGEKNDKKIKKLTPWKIFLMPTLPEISLSLFCTKGIKTAVMLWLPLYLIRAHDYDEKISGFVPLIFEFGGLIGLFMAILFSKLFKLSDLFSSFLSGLVCIIGFPLFVLTPLVGQWFMYLILLITGAFSSIMEINLCGSIPTKIGEKVEAKTSVVGVVNGFGSLGNGVEGPIVAWLTYYFGIEVLIHTLTGFSVLASFCILKAYISSRKSDLYKT